MPDLNLREWVVVVPLIAMMVWMGVYSKSFLDPVGKTTATCSNKPRSMYPTGSISAVPRARR